MQKCLWGGRYRLPINNLFIATEFSTFINTASHIYFVCTKCLKEKLNEKNKKQ